MKVSHFISVFVWGLALFAQAHALEIHRCSKHLKNSKTKIVFNLATDRFGLEIDARRVSLLTIKQFPSAYLNKHVTGPFFLLGPPSFTHFFSGKILEIRQDKDQDGNDLLILVLEEHIVGPQSVTVDVTNESVNFKIDGKNINASTIWDEPKRYIGKKIITPALSGTITEARTDTDGNNWGWNDLLILTIDPTK